MSSLPAHLDDHDEHDLPSDIERLARHDSVLAESDSVGEDTPLLWAKGLPVNKPASERCSINGRSETSQPVKKGSPQSLLLPFSIYCTAVGAVAVPKINVILALMCVQYEDPIGSSRLSDDDLCNTTAVHRRMAQFMMCAHIISGLACAVSSPRIGALSDRYGRKPLLAFTAVGLLFGDIISMAAAWNPHRMSVYWILLEFGIGGLSGSFGTTMAIIQAYVVDSADEQSRVTIISRYHAVMFLGTAIGPVAGQLFVRTVGKGDMLSVFYAAAICHAAFIAFVLLGIPESLPRRKDTQADPAAVLDPVSATTCQPSKSRSCGGNVRDQLQRSVRILQSSSSSALSLRRNLAMLASIDSIAFGIQLGFSSILIMYAEYRFGWKGAEANWFTAITNGVRAIVLTTLLPLAQHFRKRRALRKRTSTESEVSASPKDADKFNINIIRLGLVSDVVSYLGFAVANNTIIVILSGVPGAAGAAVSPIAQALMASCVDVESVGELFGTVSMIHALVRVVVPASMQFIYRTTVDSTPAVVFFVLSAVYGGAFLLSLRLRA